MLYHLKYVIVYIDTTIYTQLAEENILYCYLVIHGYIISSLLQLCDHGHIEH